MNLVPGQSPDWNGGAPGLWAWLPPPLESRKISPPLRLPDAGWLHLLGRLLKFTVSGKNDSQPSTVVTSFT